MTFIDVFHLVAPERQSDALSLLPRQLFHVVELEAHLAEEVAREDRNRNRPYIIVVEATAKNFRNDDSDETSDNILQSLAALSSSVNSSSTHLERVFFLAHEDSAPRLIPPALKSRVVEALFGPPPHNDQDHRGTMRAPVDSIVVHTHTIPATDPALVAQTLLDHSATLSAQPFANYILQHANSSRPCLEFEEQSLSYSELVLRATTMANVLREQFGIVAGSRVALLLPKNVEWIVAMLACELLGAPYSQFDDRLDVAWGGNRLTKKFPKNFRSFSDHFRKVFQVTCSTTCHVLQKNVCDSQSQFGESGLEVQCRGVV